MAKKYLDYDGLLYFWGKIKAYVDSHSGGGGGGGVTDVQMNGSSVVTGGVAKITDDDGNMGIDGGLTAAGIINGTNIQRNGKNYIGYQTFNFTVAYSAGTIGTRGYQGSADASLDGYTPIGVSVISVGSSSAYNPSAFLSGNTVYFNAYRASSSAVSNSACTVRVIYRKD